MHDDTVNEIGRLERSINGYEERIRRLADRIVKLTGLRAKHPGDHPLAVDKRRDYDRNIERARREIQEATTEVEARRPKLKELKQRLRNR